MNICIYGSANDEIDPVYFTEVKKLCEALADKGHGLVFGAGDHGMMGEAARTFTGKGAKNVIGVVPSFFNVPGVLYDKCTEMIITDTMRQRKQIMDEISDCFIAVPGGVGTLEEMFEIITLRQLGQTEKPLIIYNVNGYFDELISFIEGMKDKGFMRKSDTKRLFEVMDKPEQVLGILE